ncbi:MAG TPA: FtsX-like permease family protein, partial [Gemmatimonadaceae bacterium]|nr:FtsX-like permease family protein [Gemmatimonadaceae bacterium]
LLLARSATRQREMAIRAALGAGRSRLFRQLLTESCMLSASGTALGVAVGWAGLRGLIAMRPTSHDELRVAHLDATTLLVAIGVATISAIVFGVIGAVQSARQSTHDSLKSGTRGASADRGHRRTRSILVVSEMALSAMLIVGATLVVRSLQRMQSTDLGFEPRGLYSVPLDLAPRFPTRAARAAVLQEFTTRLRALPSVRSVVVAEVGPGSRSFTIGRMEIDGEPPAPAGSTSFIDVNHIQPEYFQTMGARLVEGATFRDTSAATDQVIVNESFARKHWARGAALGRRLRVAQTGNEPWLTIVGVAHDVRSSGPVSESTAPVLYLPMTSLAFPTILIRSAGDARTLAPAVSIGRQLGLRTITIDPVQSFIYRSTSEPRFVMLVMTAFGIIGLVLAAIGLYGVMAYTVAQQWREIGIRVALGASRSHIVQRVLVRGTSLAVFGAVVGLAGASWGTKLIESQLYGITRLDPLSFAVGAIVLVGAATLACIVPTRRALAVDPVTAIRAE